MLRTIAIFLAATAAATAAATPASADDDRSTVEFTEPGVVCLPIAPDIDVVSIGQTLGVVKFDPDNTTASIRVSLINGTDGTTTNLARVTLFPAEPFIGTPDDPERKFLLSLRQHTELVASLYALCMRVELIDAEGHADPGALEGFLEMTEVQ